MQQDRYTQIKIDADYTVFKFVSEGRYGRLTKIVSFDDFKNDMFNLTLGTVLPDGNVDFVSITNNGDRNKILTTIAGIVGTFLLYYPDKSVYITGSDNRRTLLYQRSILYGYEYLTQMFDIYGDVSPIYLGTEFEPFDKTKNYSGFMVRKKTIIDG